MNFTKKYQSIILCSSAALALAMAPLAQTTPTIFAQDKSTVEDHDHDHDHEHDDHDHEGHDHDHEGHDHDHEGHDHDHEGHDHDHDHEGHDHDHDHDVAGEQIVVGITEDGYTTSHGDHFHENSGEVPFDAILSESLLAPEDYQFNEDDVVSEVEDGYIIKSNGEYYLYVEDLSKAKNVRSNDELVLQSFGLHPEVAKAIKAIKDQLGLDESSEIVYEYEHTPEEVAEEKGLDSEFIVLYVTEEEYVTLYGRDIYLFPGQAPEDAKFAESVAAPSDYELKDEDVLYETSAGKIVKVDDRVYLLANDGQSLMPLDQVKEGLPQA